MNSRPTRKHLDSFVTHLVATLPDNITLRKTILVSLLNLLPRDYENRTQIKTLLETLRIHESQQLEFSIAEKLPPSGDGPN